MTERYVKTKDDALKLIADFQSLRVEPSPGMQQNIKDVSQLVGDRGILF